MLPVGLPRSVLYLYVVYPSPRLVYTAFTHTRYVRADLVVTTLRRSDGVLRFPRTPTVYARLLLLPTQLVYLPRHLTLNSRRRHSSLHTHLPLHFRARTFGLPVYVAVATYAGSTPRFVIDTYRTLRSVGLVVAAILCVTLAFIPSHVGLRFDYDRLRVLALVTTPTVLPDHVAILLRTFAQVTVYGCYYGWFACSCLPLAAVHTAFRFRFVQVLDLYLRRLPRPLTVTLRLIGCSSDLVTFTFGLRTNGPLSTVLAHCRKEQPAPREIPVVHTFTPFTVYIYHTTLRFVWLTRLRSTLRGCSDATGQFTC